VASDARAVDGFSDNHFCAIHLDQEYASKCIKRAVETAKLDEETVFAGEQLGSVRSNEKRFSRESG
jgi:hypothetical protein